MSTEFLLISIEALSDYEGSTQDLLNDAITAEEDEAILDWAHEVVTTVGNTITGIATGRNKPAQKAKLVTPRI